MQPSSTRVIDAQPCLGADSRTQHTPAKLRVTPTDLTSRLATQKSWRCPQFGVRRGSQLHDTVPSIVIEEDASMRRTRTMPTAMALTLAPLLVLAGCSHLMIPNPPPAAYQGATEPPNCTGAPTAAWADAGVAVGALGMSLLILFSEDYRDEIAATGAPPTATAVTGIVTGLSFGGAAVSGFIKAENCNVLVESAQVATSEAATREAAEPQFQIAQPSFEDLLRSTLSQTQRPSDRGQLLTIDELRYCAANRGGSLPGLTSDAPMRQCTPARRRRIEKGGSGGLLMNLRYPGRLGYTEHAQPGPAHGLL